MQEDDTLLARAKTKVEELLKDIQRISQEAANSGLLDKEKYVIPPHLHDLQEAELPEAQRGLVISEIAQFRERAAIREREKQREARASIPVLAPTTATAPPAGPKVREWGRSQQSPPARGAVGSGPQGYDKPVGFVRGGEDERALAGKSQKTDEELEAERKEARRRDEENSFRDVRPFRHMYQH